MAAIVGFVGVRRVKPSGPPGSPRRGAKVSIALRSAPAQKLTPPAPVRISARAVSSASKASTQEARRSAVGPSTALRRC
ncbi:MAG: hypothetical protein QOJ82_4185 [Solirubrobacteraceae bacterium]|nr:hypothetical protein [Solirubrobacteraceae bacterium]